MANDECRMAEGGRDRAEMDAWVGRVVEGHAVGWLVAANAVGVWLAVLLVWPGAGEAEGALTYGRWVPLHLNWQLYGWCALPLVGALLAWCVDERQPVARTHVHVALAAWSLALVAGGAAWLGGLTSGKLFLDWHGWARAVLSVAMVVLWTVCAAHAWSRGERDGVGVTRVRWAMLAGLLFVPGLLYWSAGREVYPAVNPDSGGATGASLLGSTLGIVTIFGLLPTMLRVRRAAGGGGVAWFWVALAGSWAVFAVVDHGHASHHAGGQVAALAVLLAWVPAAWFFFRKWEWQAAAKPWLGASFAWWLLLVASGWVTFLPGVSERLKFTNGMVAHAHLAMAGLVTCVNFVVLRQLAPKAEPRGNFWLWQGACAAHVAVLLVLGWNEAADAGALFLAEGASQVAYGVRLAAGAAMAVAAVRWAWGAAAATRPDRESELFVGEREAKVCHVIRDKGTGERLAGKRVERWARWVALGAGAMDFSTGLGLVVAPAWVLPLMGVAMPSGDGLVFLRWVGAFVGAVGASYLWAWWRGGDARLRVVLEVTVIFRAAVGVYCAVALVRGWLPWVWASVPVTDLALAGAQVWLLRALGERANDE